VGAHAFAQNVPVGDPVEDYVRVLQILGKANPGGMLIRPTLADRIVMPTSTHPWAGRMTEGTQRAIGPVTVGIADPEMRAYENSDHPIYRNDGLVWQGKGAALFARIGGWARLGPLSVTFRPEVAWSENRSFAMLPPASTALSAFSDPWYGRALDRPQRFGDGAYHQWSLGQSAVRLDWRGLAVAATTENAWWGPGIENAILLSSQAPGFPRVFVGTGRPVDIGIGRVEAQWFWGGLRESQFFDATATNDVKYVTAVAFDLELDAMPGLYLGGARLYYQDWPSGGLTGDDLLVVFQGVTKQSQETPDNPGGNDARDQLLSLFARWVLPSSGVEAYVEWSRNDHAQDWRDFILQPQHSAAYVAGFQKAWVLSGGSILRWQGEVANLERSTTFLERSEGTFYTHSLAVGGFTQDGQGVGAAVGPGGDGQYVGLDWFTRWGRIGGFLRRDVHDNDTYWRLVQQGAFGEAIRRNDVELTVGAHGLGPVPVAESTSPRNDVELAVGARGAVFLGPVDLSGAIAVGRELNRYYVARNDVTNVHGELAVRWRIR
jgi:hypothetical protein